MDLTQPILSLWGHSLDEYEQEVNNAIDHARSVFHDRYRDPAGLRVHPY